MEYSKVTFTRIISVSQNDSSPLSESVKGSLAKSRASSHYARIRDYKEHEFARNIEHLNTLIAKEKPSKVLFEHTEFYNHENGQLDWIIEIFQKSHEYYLISIIDKDTVAVARSTSDNKEIEFISIGDMKMLLALK